MRLFQKEAALPKVFRAAQKIPTCFSQATKGEPIHTIKLFIFLFPILGYCPLLFGGLGLDHERVQVWFQSIFSMMRT